MVDGMPMCSFRKITAGTESSSERQVGVDKDSCSVPNRFQGHLLERLKRLIMFLGFRFLGNIP